VSALADLIGIKDRRVSIMEEGKMKEYEIDLHNDPVLKEVGFMSCSEAGD